MQSIHIKTSQTLSEEVSLLPQRFTSVPFLWTWDASFQVAYPPPHPTPGSGDFDVLLAINAWNETGCIHWRWFSSNSTSLQGVNTAWHGFLLGPRQLARRKMSAYHRRQYAAPDSQKLSYHLFFNYTATFFHCGRFTPAWCFVAFFHMRQRKMCLVPVWCHGSSLYHSCCCLFGRR